jgi:FRG domain
VRVGVERNADGSMCDFCCGRYTGAHGRQGVAMSHGWRTSRLVSEERALATLMEVRGKRLLYRGQARCFDELIPSIERATPGQSRLEKLRLERRSIELFRATARFFSDPGEELSLRDDLVALMVLRHYSVPTRLLDWTLSPFVAAFFACQDHDNDDGEIWTFDHDRYASEGRKQWIRWPETCVGGDPRDFDFKLTAFLVEEPPDWFVCHFYPKGLPRQRAQSGLYSATARFDRDHAHAIADLPGDPAFYHRYVVDSGLKPMLRRRLKEQWGVWEGSLFPDSAGAALTAARVFKDKA